MVLALTAPLAGVGVLNEAGDVKSVSPEINLKIELRLCRGRFHQSRGAEAGMMQMQKPTIIRVYLIKASLDIHIAIYCLRSIHFLEH